MGLNGGGVRGQMPRSVTYLVRHIAVLPLGRCGILECRKPARVGSHDFVGIHGEVLFWNPRKDKVELDCKDFAALLPPTRCELLGTSLDMVETAHS